MPKLKKSNNEHIVVIDYKGAWIWLKSLYETLELGNKMLGNNTPLEILKMMKGVEKEYTTIKKVN